MKRILKKKIENVDYYKIFIPELTTKRMMELGVFGGAYLGLNVNELDDLRNEFEIWDDEGDSFEFSDAGKKFIATNELINNDGWLEAYSEGASEDFIYDLQNKWKLSLRKG